MSRTAWIAAALTGIAMSSGCGSNLLAGSPVPARNEMRTDDTSTEKPAPARPRELRLDGKDPCALVPKADWGKFYIETPGKPKQEQTFKSPECFYGNRVGAFDITLVVTEGIEMWRDGTRRAQPTDVARIHGFPTISLVRPGDTNQCDIAVDVAKGQYLLATVIVDLDKLSAVPERCAYAHMLAESAMNTLVAS